MSLRSPSFRSRSQRPKSFDAEGPDRRVGGTLEHELRDSVGGDRREQNSVAMMSGGIDEAVDQSGPEDRRIVAAPRSMADPHLIDRQLFDRGHHPPGRFEQGQDAAGGERRIVSL